MYEFPYHQDSISRLGTRMATFLANRLNRTNTACTTEYHPWGRLDANEYSARVERLANRLRGVG